jgi:hypothetical protein
MDLNINTWNITLTQNNIDNYDIHTLIHYYFMPRDEGMTYLLKPDLDKYSVIEKFVYETAIFHFKQLGIEYNKDEHFIEFCFKNNYISTCHVDTDEENSPILTCITYLSASNIPTFITDINYNDNINEYYSEKNKINLSFPKYLKQITFNGGKYYHGTCKVFENETSSELKILSIILWNKKKVKVPYYDSKIFEYGLYSKHRIKMIDSYIDKNIKLTNIHKIHCPKGEFFINKNKNDEYIINKSFFKDLINLENGKHNYLFYRFSNILNENNFENYELIELSNKIELNSDAGIKMTEKNVESCVKNMEQNTVKNDIFTKQRMIEKSFFDSVACHWIINSTEKYIMKHKQGESLSKINIDSLKNIQPFVVFSLENLFKTKIVTFYNLNNKNQTFTIKNIHVIKFDTNNRRLNEEIVDLTIKILLNDNLNIDFKDGIKMNLNKGDFISHETKLIESMIFNANPCYMLVADIVYC